MDGNDHEAIQVEYQAETGFVPAQRAHQGVQRPFGLGPVSYTHLENEQRTRQAVRGIKDMFRKDGLL